MNGTDHMEPQPELPAAMARANQELEDVLIHSTLPMFIEAVRRASPGLQTVSGELRSPKRHHLIPGVLSTRMWIKQRNAHCETLLEKWAEPFSAFAQLLPDEARPDNLRPATCDLRPATCDLRPATCDLRPVIHQAWRYLMQNHPHDSICGCSVDQVHKEMEVRFDWVEQIGEEVTRQSLARIASAVNTADLAERAQMGLVVFNPVAGPRTDVVTAEVQVPDSPSTRLRAGLEDFVLFDDAGGEIPYQVLNRRSAELASLDLDRDGFLSTVDMAEGGHVQGMAVQEVHIEVEQELAHISITLTEHGQPDVALLERSIQEVRALLTDEAIRRYKVRVHLATAVEFCFVVEGVPGHGYKTYLIKARCPNPISNIQYPTLRPVSGQASSIENEFFFIVPDPADGTLHITDKAAGLTFEGLNRFVDGGDRGDEYTYCRPENDLVVSAPATAPTIGVIEAGPARWTLEITMTYRLPVSLAADRSVRSQETVEVPIKTRVSLYPGVRRIDFSTTVENHAQDHRLRVHFPIPVQTDCSHAESHFDVVQRPLDLPQDTADWVEQPAPTHPQRTFVDVSDGKIGFMVINKGLPEYEVLRGAAGGVEVALTLLRCMGWLSRGDLHSRPGHAGPAIETPGAQCLGKQTFEYALVPHSDGWEACFEQAHAFNASLRAVPAGVHGGLLPPQLSFVQIRPASPSSPPTLGGKEGEAGLVVSAIKQPEDGEGLIVRLYNITAEEVTGRLRVYRPFARAVLVNLNEEEMEELKSNERGEVELSVRGRQMVTVKLERFGTRRSHSEPTGF
jgi:alpha-mannosidase